MKSALKFIMTSIGLVLIGIAVAIMLLSTRLEEFAQARVEDKLSHLFNTDAQLDRLRVLPFQGALALEGLTVNNPPEYEAGPALKCDQVLLYPELTTLFSRAPTLRKVVLENADINLLYKMGEGTNIHWLAEQAANLAESEANEDKGRTLVVEEWSAPDAEIRLGANVLPEASLPVDLAPFKFKEGHAVNAAKVSSIFLRSMVKESLTINGIVPSIAEKLKKITGGDED